MLRLATFWTPSHAAMAREFVLDRVRGFSEIVAVEFPQSCPSGSFKEKGWNACMDDKLRLLLSLPIDGMPTLYVDADCLLLPGVERWAEETIARMVPDEIAYSDDVIQWCAGVMLFRSTQAVHDWWRLVLDMSRLLDMPDQETIAVLRGNAKRLPIPMSVLPAAKVANWGTLGNREPWKGEPFTVPASAVVWHANWTIGIESKMAMLRAAASQAAADGRC
jgi:hypothetical protein